MYNCIIFDVDGTILDTKYSSVCAAKSAAEEINHKKYNYDDFEITFGMPTHQMAQNFGIDDTTLYVSTVDRYYEEYSVEHNKIFDGMLYTIETLLKKEVNIGVVTSKTLWEYEFEFKRFDLIKYFPNAVYAELTENHKPHPQPVYKYFELSAVKNPKALFVGDTVYDYKCATSAGIDFAFANWSGNTTIREGKHVLNKPEDILALV